VSGMSRTSPPPRSFPRDWVSFRDPADPERHEIRADLTWLLSRWGCIFGAGCHGIVAGRAGDGCCSHGAFFSDAADEARVRAAASELTPELWARHGLRGVVANDELDGEKARRTRTLGGVCVFANPPGFPGGAGCALHALALATGRNPLETKPDVCWQLPIRRLEEYDDTGVLVTTLTEYDRPGWGEGGADLHWWCTESPEAHTRPAALYREAAAELTALIGEPAYAELARLCAQREGRLLAVHPATAAAGAAAARTAGTGESLPGLPRKI
jgi:hypothetical protein